MFNFDDLIGAVEGQEFDEKPVGIKEFATSEDYLGQPMPSPLQLQLMEASTQILKRDTLITLWGKAEGEKRWRQTVNEVIANIGKGGGKDWSSEISCAYVVYQLLCLKDPSKYYGKPSGDHIDILNIAINAQQANNVFFAGFKRMIENSPWFRGRFEVKAGQFDFDKGIRVLSGHSEREAYEGYNFIYVVLDEISGFAVDNSSGNEKAKTADAIYNMYAASVSSRFDEFGKVVLLSFSRFKGDFISRRYEEVIAEKHVIHKQHKFKLNDDLPDGMEENEFTIEWDEDHIIRYKEPKVWAIRRTTWDFNPTKTPESFKRDFFRNPADSIGRFASQPPEAVEGFFRDHEKVDAALCRSNGVNEDGTFVSTFLPQEDKEYFVHVDLAKKHDNCVVSMAHVDRWEQSDFGGGLTTPVPVVIVDTIRVWTPTKDKTVDFTEVRDHIVSLRNRGFNVKLVTFDRWRSDDMIDYLRNIGMRSEVLSVALQHYTDLKMLISEGRCFAPEIPLLAKELKQLRIMPNGKIDHPRSGSKDIGDSMCGAVYNCISHTMRGANDEIDIRTAEDLQRELAEQRGLTAASEDGSMFPIRAPGRHAAVPQDVADFLSAIRML